MLSINLFNMHDLTARSMSRVLAFTIAFITLSYGLCWSTIINIPDDYPTIQQGIDASTDGDTVLVQPGTYYENINFNGHNIVLGSLFITTDDASYISATVIDADGLYESVVTFESGENSSTELIGFTIKNGRGGNGAGIYCSNSNPCVLNNIISENLSADGYGGGIYSMGSTMLIKDNIIIGNILYADMGGGGSGIACISNDGTVISNNILIRNDANAVWGNPSTIFLQECTSTEIINNTVCLNGYYFGLYLLDTEATIKNSIFWEGEDNVEIYGQNSTFSVTYCNIDGGWEGEGNIDEYSQFVDLENDDFNICQSSPCIDAGDPSIEDPDGSRSDIGVYFDYHPDCSGGNRIYVDTNGSDESGDGSYEYPYRTIQFAVDLTKHSDTVIVENGTYYENIGIVGKNAVIASNYIDSGNEIDILTTIINSAVPGVCISMTYCWGDMTVTGLSIRNGDRGPGGGMTIWDSSLKITNNRFYDNYRYGHGGGFESRFCDLLVEGNLFYNNHIEAFGAAMAIFHGTALVKNNTIVGNTSGTRGGGIFFWIYYGHHDYINNILWDNYAPEDPQIYDYGYGNDPSITYCDIQGGWGGEGNIDADPLFRDPENGDFHLMSTACGDPQDSPCIDAGDPSIEDIWLDCEWGLGTSLSDMGAYGGGDSTMVGIGDDKEPEVPIRFGLSQNYPNPFNAVTVIRYSLPKPSDVIITIYDILGRKVETLFDAEQPAGYHQIIWDASDHPSGMYFYRIQAGDFHESRSCLLLK